MNKNDAAQYLPLVQALADGKVIQEYRHVDLNKQAWMDCVNPEFDRYPASNYRIKPEPREVWVTFSPNGTPLSVASVHPCYVPSDSRGESAYVSRYREVLE